METPRRKHIKLLSLFFVVSPSFGGNSNYDEGITSPTLTYRGPTTQKRRREPINVVLLIFCICFFILSVINLRNQIKFLTNHDVTLLRNDQELLGHVHKIEMKTMSSERQVISLVSISSASQNSRQIKNDKIYEMPKQTDKFQRGQRNTIDAEGENSEPFTIQDKVEITSITHQESIEKFSDGALCIQNSRWYGRTFNRILELANALAIVADNNANDGNQTKETFIGLSPNLSEWYETFLDRREDIILNYRGPCLSTWTPKDLFFHKQYKNSNKSRIQLQSLIPKQSYRDEAKQALALYSNQQQQQVITVHRRDLEGVCIKKAMSVAVACVKDRVLVKRSMSTNTLADTCNYDYNMIRNNHKSSIDKNESVVVLCTDQQKPELDDTFPIRSNYSFPVEAWIMATSDIHYGNPHSTVDLVVAVWRTGQHRRTHPEECYEDY